MVSRILDFHSHNLHAGDSNGNMLVWQSGEVITAVKAHAVRTQFVKSRTVKLLMSSLVSSLSLCVVHSYSRLIRDFPIFEIYLSSLLASI